MDTKKTRIYWLGLKLGFIHCLGLNSIFGLTLVYYWYDLIIYSPVDPYIPTKTTEDLCQLQSWMSVSPNQYGNDCFHLCMVDIQLI